MREKRPYSSEFLDFLPVDEFELQDQRAVASTAYSSIAPVTDSIVPPRAPEVSVLSRVKVSLILGATCILAFSGGLLASQPRSAESVAHASMQPLVAPVTLGANTQAPVSLQDNKILELPTLAISVEPSDRAGWRAAEKQREAEARAKKSERQKEKRDLESKSNSKGDSQVDSEKAASADSEPEFAPVLPAFDPASASSSLNALVDSARGCLKAGDPSSGVRVSVTFAPSGRATVATLDGPPYAGTAVGGCIARVFRAAKVAPFDGSSTTVHKSFSVP